MVGPENDGRPSIRPKERPQKLEGVTEKIPTGCGDLDITVNFDDVPGRPWEVFIHPWQAGECGAAQTEMGGRLTSLALRSGVEVDEVIKQLRGIQCPRPRLLPGGNSVLSCADAIAKVLEKHSKGKSLVPAKISPGPGQYPSREVTVAVTKEPTSLPYNAG